MNQFDRASLSEGRFGAEFQALQESTAFFAAMAPAPAAEPGTANPLQPAPAGAGAAGGRGGAANA
eukprot:SAG22_NODE_8643_length_639_cov_19.107407_1_plen_64_part_10